MRFLAIAYSIVWTVIFAYVVYIGLRISKLEKEIEVLKESRKS